MTDQSKTKKNLAGRKQSKRECKTWMMFWLKDGACKKIKKERETHMYKIMRRKLTCSK